MGEESARTVSAVWRRLSPFIGFLLLLAAMAILRRELRSLNFQQLSYAVAAIPLRSLVLALLLTGLNYFVLTGCDQLAFVSVGRHRPRWQIGIVSFVGYAIANSVGFALVSGTSARYRFYARWGLGAQEISRIVVFYSITFWLGALVLGGWSLLMHPLNGVRSVPGHTSLAPFAWRSPITIRGFTMIPPRPLLVAGQFALSILDWTLAVAVLWVLLPAPRPPFAGVVSAFVAAQLLALASHVPGGVGIFESLMVLALQPLVSAAVLLPALLAFRVIYYLVPLGLALLVLLVDGFYQRRHHVARWGNAFGALTVALAPKILAVFTFIAGTVLVFSGVTPAESGRLQWLADVLPLPVVEASHFIASLVGLALLLVSQGLARRLDAAYALTLTALGVGIVTSLTKGADYEEALILATVVALLIPARAAFDRRATLFNESFSRLWLSAMVTVLVASFWLGEFAFRHVQYSYELWWRFEFDQDAPRFLRASVGVTVGLLVVGIRQLLRPAPPEIVLPSEDDLARAADVIAKQPLTAPFLAYLRDKSILWNDDRTAFLMYGVQGGTWVALNDPVGPPEAVAGLVRRFLELVDDGGGVPVFYEVRKDWLHCYADYGLTFVKLGEEARVPLSSFSLEGGSRRGLRQTVRRLEKENCRFRLVPAGEVASILPMLREVSDEWLTAKAVAEKGFSLGFFDATYIARFPVGVLERSGRIEAFANVWPGSDKTELSVDLMRHRKDAPNRSVEGLLVHLMLWGRDEGYQRFILGMAPLSGLEASDVAPLWVRIGGYLYEHSGSFYNFQGLRAYKEKFDPLWEPRYLAYPGGFALPKVLADISALIGGGYRAIFLKPRVPK